jgi:small subunit ribosomal protein S17
MVAVENEKGTQNASRPLSLRGHVTEGTVVSDKNKLTVIVEKPTLTYISKYKRYARTHSRIPAHNPLEIGAKLGDLVKIAECRRISKTKAWIVTEIVRKAGELEAVQASKIEKKREERVQKRHKEEEKGGEKKE